MTGTAAPIDEILSQLCVQSHRLIESLADAQVLAQASVADRIALLNALTDCLERLLMARHASEAHETVELIFEADDFDELFDDELDAIDEDVAPFTVLKRPDEDGRADSRPFRYLNGAARPIGQTGPL